MKLNRRIFETRREKWIDFVIGFFGWRVINFMRSIVGSVVYGGVLDLFEALFPDASYDHEHSGHRIFPNTVIAQRWSAYIICSDQKTDSYRHISGLCRSIHLRYCGRAFSVCDLL